MQTQSPNRQMNRLLKYMYYPIILFENVVVNEISSRHLRKWFYQLLGVEIEKNMNIPPYEVLGRYLLNV